MKFSHLKIINSSSSIQICVYHLAAKSIFIFSYDSDVRLHSEPLENISSECEVKGKEMNLLSNESMNWSERQRTDKSIKGHIQYVD